MKKITGKKLVTAALAGAIALGGVGVMDAIQPHKASATMESSVYDSNNVWWKENGTTIAQSDTTVALGAKMSVGQTLVKHSDGTVAVGVLTRLVYEDEWAVEHVGGTAYTTSSGSTPAYIYLPTQGINGQFNFYLKLQVYEGGVWKTVAAKGFTAI